MIFCDVETCGFHGPIVLIQYAIDDGPIEVHSVWRSTVKSTMNLIEMIVNHEGGICGFNITFDWFHLCQLYTTLSLFEDKSVLPENHIHEYAAFEERARFLDICLKPKHALDLYLHALKGPYQSCLDREDIRIKRVPTALAFKLADELNKRVQIKDIYFARKENPHQHWTVDDAKNIDGSDNNEFKHIVLRFAPTSTLKALYQDVCGVTDVDTFADLDPPSAPMEFGYAPFALAVGPAPRYYGTLRRSDGMVKKEGAAWPLHIKKHIDFYTFNKRAREYAKNDIVYTRALYKHFGCPLVDDDDSLLACMVGSVRWHGFAIDVNKIKALREDALKLIANTQWNFKSQRVCITYLKQVMSETEQLALLKNDKLTTKSLVLEYVAKWRKEEICAACGGMGCTICDDSGVWRSEEMHPAAVRATEILTYRKAFKRIELFDKLLRAGRFHASFRVIGTLSTRMSGADGLNAQGIDHTKLVRSCFTLADPGFLLCAGDFDSFEVSLADAVYNDPMLRADLDKTRPCNKCKGNVDPNCKDCKGTGLEKTSIHALLGTFLFDMTYDEIIATKGLPGEKDRYTRSKQGTFGLLYGGTEFTLQNRVGVEKERAEKAYQKWIDTYIVWGKARQSDFDDFCSMRQPGGIGTKVTWRDPKDYAAAMFGFRRYFTLENMICKVLFDLAEKPPREWQGLQIKVVRRDREQTACGAVRSALFAAAFAVQASCMRAAANHKIQSSGAEITKRLETTIWTEHQPTGIGPWIVQLINVHDELLSSTKPEYANAVKETVNKTIASFVPKVPLISMGWKTGLKNWAEK